MTTVINTSGNTEDTGLGFVIGVLLAVAVIVVLFFSYALPMIRGTADQKNEPLQIQVTVPATDGSDSGPSKTNN